MKVSNSVTGNLMKWPLLIFVAWLSLILSGCPGLSDSGDDGDVTRREIDVSGKLAVALGGSADGVDEIVIDEPFTTLTFDNNDPDLFDLEVSGKTARVIPLDSGIGYVTPVVNGHARDPVE